MRKRTKKQMEIKKILLAFGVILCFFIFVVYLFQKKDRFLFIEKLFKDGIMSIQSILVLPFSIGDANPTLLEDTYMKALKSDIEALKKQLSIQDTYTDFRITNGKVIARDSSYWYHKVTIDKGEKDHIQSGDIVINANGLIGKVSKTSYSTSEVELLTDPKNRLSVSVVLEKSVFSGITRGYSEEKNCILIEGLSNTKDVKEGDTIITNGLGGVYPKGIYVGKIGTILQKNDLNGSAFCMISDVSFDHLGYVSILGKLEEIS